MSDEQERPTGEEKMTHQEVLQVFKYFNQAKEIGQAFRLNDGGPGSDCYRFFNKVEALLQELAFLKDDRGVTGSRSLLSKRLEVTVAEFAGALYQTHYFEKHGAAALGLKLQVSPRGWNMGKEEVPEPFEIDLKGKLAVPVDATLDYPIEGAEDYDERLLAEAEEDERRAEEKRKLQLLRDQFAMRAPPIPSWFKIDPPQKPGASGRNPFEGYTDREIYELQARAWPYYWADLMIEARDEE